VDPSLLNTLNRLKKTKTIYTQSRNSTILYSFIDRSFFVYNGKTYYKVVVNKDHVGMKFGQFSYSKKRCVYRLKKKSKKK